MSSSSNTSQPPPPSSSSSSSSSSKPTSPFVGPGWTCCKCSGTTSLRWLDCEDKQCRHARCDQACVINKPPSQLRKIAGTWFTRSGLALRPQGPRSPRSREAEGKKKKGEEEKK